MLPWTNSLPRLRSWEWVTNEAVDVYGGIRRVRAVPCSPIRVELSWTPPAQSDSKQT